MEKRLIVYVVTYDGRTEPQVPLAMRREINIAAKAGWKVEFGRWLGDALLAHARNGVVHRFMKSGATKLFFWDTDVVPEEGAMLRLIEQPVDIVCGCYRRRFEKETYPIIWLADRDGIKSDLDTRLLEVMAVPMGFTCLSRDALQRMIAHFADRKYFHPGVKDTAICLFDCGLDIDPYGGDQLLYWGEDTTFCKRGREAGVKIWVDPEIKVDHIGFVDPEDPSKGKKIFPGHLGDYLRKVEAATT